MRVPANVEETQRSPIKVAAMTRVVPVLSLVDFVMRLSPSPNVPGTDPPGIDDPPDGLVDRFPLRLFQETCPFTTRASVRASMFPPESTIPTLRPASRPASFAT